LLFLLFTFIQNFGYFYRFIWANHGHQNLKLDAFYIFAAYLATTKLVVAAIAFYFGVTTDVPLGAVGGAIGIMILSNILDAISGLGALRNWLPSHFSFSWFDALSSEIDWSQMIRGASYSVILSAILTSISFIRFAKKDVTS